MPGKKHGPDEIIRKLRQAEAWQNDGQTVGQVCQKLEVSEQTFHRWRRTYGGMQADEMRRRTIPNHGCWSGCTRSCGRTHASATAV